jgi:Helicase HerA, central domain
MLRPALLTTEGPAPGLQPRVRRPTVASAYFALSIDAAVNLLEAREYQGLSRADRLGKALAEQQGFLNAFSDPALRVALDLRITAGVPGPSPLTVALIGRAWGEDSVEVAERAGRLCSQLHASLPRHVVGTPLADEATIGALLEPLPDGPADSAVITRHELTGRPARPDAAVPYFFSVVPFTWVDSDWSAVYAALAAAPVPLVVSAAVRAVEVPASLSRKLADQATFYGRLAREDEQEGGLYFGRQKLAPDAFAVDAEHVFRDLARRLGQKAFALRVQVSAAGKLPAGIAETVAAAISPPDPVGGSHLERERGVSAYDIRVPVTDADRSVAALNLAVVDTLLLPGRPEIWARRDPPDPQLALLAVLGDAKDASCAFRLPVALDGIVPGFRVRRGAFGHAEAVRAEGPSIRLGRVADTGQPVSVPLHSLTRHALLAGSTGSGKTTTAMGILRQLWRDHQIPFLVIEPVNADADDYRRLAREPGFEQLEVVTAGDEGGRPLRFNPFEVPAGVLVGEHASNLLACFKAAFGLWEPLPSIYTDALSLTYLRAGFLASERPGAGVGAGRGSGAGSVGGSRSGGGTGPGRSDGAAAWPTAVEFSRAMREVTADLGYAGEVQANIEAASIRRARQLVRGPAGSVFLTSLPNDIAGLLDHPVILELKSLGSGDEQALMMALLLNAVTEHYQAARGASPSLVHVTVVEEAHRLLARSEGGKAAEDAQAKEKAAEAFANTLAENRKYGEGVIICEQLPTKLVADAVKNTNLKIMHRLTAEDDRRYVGLTMGLDEPQLRFATRLRTGEALAYGEEFAEAAHVSIPPFAGASGASAAAVSVSVPAVAVPPFADCSRCRSVCAYRGAGLAMVRDPSVVDRVTDHVAALGKARQTEDELTAHWAALIAFLRSHVLSFPSMPAREPGLTDAMYCLFLHALAVRNMRYHPAWARRH